MEEKRCEGCGRHCPIDALQCNRGRMLNGVTIDKNESQSSNHHHHEFNDQIDDSTIDGKINKLIRMLGHQMHHSNKALEVNALSEIEKEELYKLLEKITNNN